MTFQFETLQGCVLVLTSGKNNDTDTHVVFLIGSYQPLYVFSQSVMLLTSFLDKNKDKGLTISG